MSKNKTIHTAEDVDPASQIRSLHVSSSVVDHMRTSHAKSRWSWVALMVGMALWAQTVFVPLSHEISWSDTRWWAVVAYVLPLAALFAGVVFSLPVILFGAFFCAMLIGFVVAPELSSSMTTDPLLAARLGVTWIAYLAAASHACLCARYETQYEHDDNDSMPTTSQLGYRVNREKVWYIGSRIIIAWTWFVVIIWAVFFDAHIAGNFVEFYGKHASEGIIFTTLVLFFSWSVCVYSFVVLPSLNYEYDQQMLVRQLRPENQGGARKKTLRHLVVTLLILILIGILGMWWTLV